jgi:hypothetical protein
MLHHQLLQLKLPGEHLTGPLPNNRLLNEGLGATQQPLLHHSAADLNEPVCGGCVDELLGEAVAVGHEVAEQDAALEELEPVQVAVVHGAGGALRPVFE